MSARHLLLPAATVLFALAACDATAAPGSSPSASAAAAAPGGTPASAPAPGGNLGCPSAKSLAAVVELPKGVSFGGVECVKDWAGADPQGAGVGDGWYLFHHTAAGWKYYGEGSGYDCSDMGLTEAPFCISEPDATTEPATPKRKPAAPTKKAAAPNPRCPTAKELEALYKLRKGQTFQAVECAEDFAGTAATASGPNDNVGWLIFHYKAGSGWKYYDEGINHKCVDLGLDESTSFCVG